ncbi:hypothetical protein IU433_05240 [Nocardia puris]|uniref:ABC-type transporter Mla subunit MlaD n=1 Tax=Nocardia puris TaxID=208602 RepID=A0A366E186_9NOCA|nr:hypothetical protein [Nocardia puris]MBF6209644.1 hypothetical protein [Nocardia puris]MBF6366216.1 hypothetical protein [Nocardia puris]MBF6458445.1 hypothetical protein [Nocardia puris]RBO96092.1 hypothetical protein DFR74_101103 [Nocardia puris]
MSAVPVYGLPGTAVQRRGARILGLLTVVMVVAGSALLLRVDRELPDGRIRVELRTDHIGPGIAPGSTVRLDGVTIGVVDRIDVLDRQRGIVVVLDGDRVLGLTGNLTVDYTAGNFFGITEIVLRRGAGGPALREGMVLDLTAPGRVNDASVGVLLDRLAALTGEALTPDLTELVMRSSDELTVLLPMVQAAVELGRLMADTQRQPLSTLIDPATSALYGLGSLVDGGVGLLHNLGEIEVLRSDREMFEGSVDFLTGELFPALTRIGRTAHRGVGGYADLVTPLLQAVARIVSAPQQSGAELRLLIERLGGAFIDTVDGPVPTVDLALDLVPILGGSPAPTAGAPR